MTCSRSITVWARNSTSSKMVGVRPERDGRAGPAPRRLAGDLELADRLAAVVELDDVVVAVPIDLQEQPGGQRVDHRDAHAVEPAGDLVPAALAELAAGVEHGQDHLGGRLVLGTSSESGGEAAAVVGYPHPAVGQQRDVDPVAVAGHGLVDRVVHDLPHEVVEARRAGGADVHPGSLADRVQAFENGDVARVVRGLPHGAFLLRLQRHRRALSQCPSGWEPASRRAPGRAERTSGPSDLPRFQCPSVAARCIAPGRWSRSARPASQR